MEHETQIRANGCCEPKHDKLEALFRAKGMLRATYENLKLRFGPMVVESRNIQILKPCFGPRRLLRATYET